MKNHDARIKRLEAAVSINSASARDTSYQLLEFVNCADRASAIARATHAQAHDAAWVPLSGPVEEIAIRPLQARAVHVLAACYQSAGAARPSVDQLRRVVEWGGADEPLPVTGGEGFALVADGATAFRLNVSPEELPRCRE